MGQILKEISYFNPRTLVGCDALACAVRPPLAHFNPRTLVGCDLPPPPTTLFTAISIHAPSWGATDYVPYWCAQYAISIHAPSWGATPKITKPDTDNMDFNPRTLVGCDAEGKVRRAHKQDFNPRTLVGCDDNAE